MIKKTCAITFLFVLLLSTSPGLPPGYPSTSDFSRQAALSSESLLFPDDPWLIFTEQPEFTLPLTNEFFPLERVQVPENDSEVFYSQINPTPQGSDLSLYHEKGRFQSTVSFNFAVSGAGAQLLGPRQRIERGPYWQRPSEMYEPKISFLEREVPVSWKGLRPASEIAQSRNIYHYLSGESKIRLTDHDDFRFFYQGSDFREAPGTSAEFSLSQFAQAGAVLGHRWNRWLKNEMGYTVSQDGWEDAGYSSRTRTHGPNAALYLNFPSFFGYFYGSSVKFFGDIQKQDWLQDNEISSSSIYRTAGMETPLEITQTLRLIPGFSLKDQNNVWSGENFYTKGFQTYVRMENRRKWGKAKLNVALETPVEYQRKYSSERLNFRKSVTAGWGLLFRKRIELNHRYTLFMPGAEAKHSEQYPSAMDLNLKYKLHEKHPSSVRLHGGYFSETLLSEETSSEAIVDGSFIYEF